MSAPGIRKHLRRQSGIILLVGLGATLLGGSLLAGLGMLSADKGAKEAPPVLASVVFLSAALATLGVIVGWKALREARSWRRHPDVLALARYGPPEFIHDRQKWNHSIDNTAKVGVDHFIVIFRF